MTAGMVEGSRPLRFCMVTTFYPPYHFGGDATFVQALSESLADAGHHVEVVHCVDAFRILSNRKPDLPPMHPRVKVHRLESGWGWLSPLVTQQTGRPGLKRAALRRILSQPFDVVNFHNISLVGGPGILGMSRAPVTLYTLHEHWLVCPMHIFWKNGTHACDSRECISCCLRSHRPPQLWRYSGLIQRSLRHVDMMLAPSEFTARVHRESGISTPMQVVPLFSRFSLPPDLPPFQAPARPRFVFCGRMIAPKGVAELVEEFFGLPQYDLLIAGDGELRAQLERKAASYPNIRFLGWLSKQQLAETLAQCTAFILPSLTPEAFPLMTLEAFACGTPAIVRVAGGSAESLREYGAGFSYSNSAELRRALEQASVPGARERLSAGALTAYRTRYSAERYLRDYLAIVQDIGRQKQAAFVSDFPKQ